MTRLTVRKTYKLFIGGQFPRSESGRSFAAFDPQEARVANLARASRKDFRNAVVAARKAQSAWAGRTAFNRAQILYRMAEMLESRAAVFADLLVNDAGYSNDDAQTEVHAAVDRLVWYAGWSDKFSQLFGGVNPVAGPFFNVTTPQALGVVTVLAPQTAPLLGLVSALAPVIVSGNSAVVLVDNDAPHLAIEFAEVLATSDLPGGVVNILTGHREEIIEHVASHRDVDGVFAFGLSKEIRTTLEVAAAESVKRLKVLDDRAVAGWQEATAQSPYWILPFVEFQTTWHPMGR